MAPALSLIFSIPQCAFLPFLSFPFRFFSILWRKAGQGTGDAAAPSATSASKPPSERDTAPLYDISPNGVQATNDPEALPGEKKGKEIEGRDNAGVTLENVAIELEYPRQFNGAVALKSEKIVYCPIQKVRSYCMQN